MRELKVGALIAAGLAVLALGTFLIGESNQLFSRKAHYTVQFRTVSGLASGNPVQLNGVTVGSVEDIELPTEVDERLLTVHIQLDGRYADRVRTDSEARIKTLGLLGDKYIQLTSGSPGSPAIPSGGEIRAAEQTDVDELIASGENAVDNFVAISVSLREILARMERGEGVLGQLTADSESGNLARDKVLGILDSIEAMTAKAERGEGSLGRLLHDDTLAIRLEASIGRLESLLDAFDSGDGALPALLRDAETKETLDRAIRELASASSEFADLTRTLKEGDGLLPRLLNDEQFGTEVTRDLESLLDRLSRIAGKLEEGDGTAAQLINDPEIYLALQDILVGIDESRLLRWLIRNRQKKGIEVRYDEAVEEAAQEEALEEALEETSGPRP